MWFRMDADICLHPKVIQAGNAALGAWFRALGWCAKHSPDGVLSVKQLRMFDARKRDIERLIEAGLLDVWDPQAAKFLPNSCQIPAKSSPDSCQKTAKQVAACGDNLVKIHDWEEHQFALVTQDQKRAKTRERVARYRARQQAQNQAPKRGDVTRYKGVTGDECNALRNADVTPLDKDKEEDLKKGCSNEHPKESHHTQDSQRRPQAGERGVSDRGSSSTTTVGGAPNPTPDSMHAQPGHRGHGQDAGAGQAAQVTQAHATSPSTKQQPSKRQARGRDYTPEFETFWRAYPRHVNKPGAWRAWQTALANGNDPQAITSAAIAYAQDPNLPPAQYQPHPATWLNGERWNDGPCPPRRPETSNGHGHGYGGGVNPYSQAAIIARMQTRHLGAPLIDGNQQADPWAGIPQGWQPAEDPKPEAITQANQTQEPQWGPYTNPPQLQTIEGQAS